MSFNYAERECLSHPCCPGLEWGGAVDQHPTTWKTKDKRILVISDMSRRHLLLVIRLLIRRACYARARACNQMRMFARSWPYDDVDHEASRVFKSTWKDHVCTHYKPLLVEARVRDLKNASEKVIDAYGERCDRLGLSIELAGIVEYVNEGLEKEGRPPIKFKKPAPHWSRP